MNYMRTSSDLKGMAQSRPDQAGAKPAWADLLAEIRQRSTEFEDQGHVSADLIEQLQTIGFYRAAVAKQFGGDELAPAEILTMVEALSEADGSVGWVASFAPQTAMYLAALPLAGVSEIYRDGPDKVVAGALFPLQPARLVDGGFMVSGQWSFGSGCMAASWIGVGVMADDPLDPAIKRPLIAMMPVEAAEIVPNWDVVGLRATGSHDLRVKERFVGSEFTALRGGPPVIDGALYRFPAICWSAFNHSVVGLGIARAALDAMAKLATQKASITGAPRPADRGYIQLGMAKADAQLRSARAFYYEQVDCLWQIVLKGDTPTVEQRAVARLAAANAAHVGAQVTQAAFTMAGTTSTKMKSPIQRHLRDSMMVTQHAFTNEGNIEAAGQVMLGLQAAPGFP